MAFKQMTQTQYPPRLWCLVGFPGSGKSTFAVQMRGPLLAIDADHRFQEVLALAGDKPVYQLSDIASDNTDPDRIAALLAEHMPATKVGTITVDSLTAIITPLVVQAMIDKDAGRNKNLYAGFRDKALAMRQLQDSVTRWGCDTLWIYHLQDSKDAAGKDHTRATVSKTELARLLRSINLQLEIVADGDKRGVKVVWARRGRSGMILWDESGAWIGMPEKIEAAVYDNLTEAEQKKLARPDVFPNAETAIAWGMERGAFKAIQHARNTYDKLRREQQPKDAREMAALWIAEVEARVLTGETNGHDESTDAPAGDLPDGEQPGAPAQTSATSAKSAPAKPTKPAGSQAQMDTAHQLQRTWPGPTIQAVIAAKLAGTGRDAVKMLNLSESLSPADAPDVVVSWAKHYQAAVTDGNDPQAAAFLADADLQKRMRGGN